MSWIAKSNFPGSSGIAFQELIELNNGKILSVGGEHTTSGVEVLEPHCYLYDPVANSWSQTGDLNVLRVTPMLVKLNDGRILCTGGRALIVSGDSIADTEIYDPNTGLWTVTGSLNTSRYRAAIWKLNNGDVLIAGGGSGSGSFTPQTSTERFNGSTWTDLGQALPHPALEPYYFSLTDGTPVIAGAQNGSTGFNGSYTWTAGSGWTSLTAQPIGVHASDTGRVAILANGDILLTGAAGNTGGTLNDSLDVAMIFHQGPKTWETVGSLNNRRQDCIIGVLDNGGAFVTSGFVDPFSAVTTGELYDPVAKTWSINSTYALTNQQTFASYVQTTVGNSLGVYTIGGWDLTGTIVNNLYPSMTANEFFQTRSVPSPMSNPSNPSDPSAYNLRYNEVQQTLEAAIGNFWIPVTLTNPGEGITQLTGDVTAGPGTGSQAATLKTVNSNVGSFTSANITVNAKGLITAASNGGSAGLVLNVTQATLANSETTTSTTFVASPALQLTLTPTSASSRFMIQSSFECSNHGTGNARFTLLRGATNLGGSAGMQLVTVSDTPVTVMFVDSPATASPITYALGYESSNGSTIQIGEGTGVVTAVLIITELAS